MEKLIIEAAINEQASRADNPRVPYAPEEIAAEALAAARAGAAIVHFHARDPDTGDMLHPGTESYLESMRLIRAENPDVLLYPTYGISPTPQERFSHLEALAQDPHVHCDFATIDPGAVNYADFSWGEARAWRDGGDGDGAKRALGWDYVLSVSHAEIEYFFELARKHAIRFSFTVREPGHVRHVLAYRELGWVRDPLFFKVTMSANHAWGLAPSEEGARILTEAVIPSDVPYRFMTYVEGDAHARLSRWAVEQGGHVRTGVGDNPLFEGEPLTNAGQVERIVEMADRIGRAIADPRQTRELLAHDPT